ncbi:MAG: ribonuclease E/G [Bacteroides sp.]
MQKLLITNVNDIAVSTVCEDMTMRTIRVLQEDSILGNIYVGRVENIVNNIQAAFVEYAKGQKGYYSLTENDKHIFLNRKNTDKLCAGDLILVQVSRESVKTKEPTLTSKISLTGRFCALSLNNKLEHPSVFASRKITDEERKSHLQRIVKETVKGVMRKHYGDKNEEKNCGSTASEQHVSGQPVFDIIIRTNAENAADDAVVSEAAKLVERLIEIMKYAPTRVAFTKMYSPTDTCLEDVQNLRATNLEKIITDIPEIYETVRRYLLENEPEELSKLELYDDKLLSLASLYNIAGQLKNALSTRVWLPSGGYLVIEPTEALTVIDVNTGKFTGNRKLTDNTYLKINKQAAEEIGRQLALRNLSGIIIVDFINLDTKEERKELMDYLEQILSKDMVPASVVDMTKLGLVEITRKKIRKPLHEILNGNRKAQE